MLVLKDVYQIKHININERNLIQLVIPLNYS